MRLNLETCTAEEIIQKSIDSADKEFAFSQDRSVIYPFRVGVLQHYIFELVALRDRLKEKNHD
ncbi:MAG: hypothetical protein ACWGQW_11295 [bacterium]